MPEGCTPMGNTWRLSVSAQQKGVGKRLETILSLALYVFEHIMKQPHRNGSRLLVYCLIETI